MKQRRWLARPVIAWVLIGCSSTSTPKQAELPDASVNDAGRVIVDAGSGGPRATHDAGSGGGPADASRPLVDAGSGRAPSDAGPTMLASCPASGRGAIVAPGPCFVFTPADLGSDPSGDNATVSHYALEPAGTPRGMLVLFLNASLATPAAQIADPKVNLYSTLAADGFHVIALAYRSTAVIGELCLGDAACFGPTRESIILGTFVTGAAPSLHDVRQDEGVTFRLDAALARLAAERPTSGWNAFIAPGATPEQRIDWPHVSAVGHSQGGGHAAYLGRLFPLRRVVQLSSTCDAVRGTPAPWTAASEKWATSPATAFYGLAVPTSFSSNGTPNGGDTTCSYHLAVWMNMGMDAANEHDDAATCTGATPHTSVIQCPVNAPRWAPLFE